MYLINMCVLLFGLFTYGMLSVLTGIGFTALQSLTLNHLLKRRVMVVPFPTSLSVRI